MRVAPPHAASPMYPPPPPTTGGCCNRATFNMFALGGSAGFCLSFVLCIIGIAVPHTIWLFALALFLGCPVSLGFAIGGVCCIACDKTPPPDARHHAGAPPPMGYAHQAPWGADGEEEVLDEEELDEEEEWIEGAYN